jgi:hypothetical protein
MPTRLPRRRDSDPAMAVVWAIFSVALALAMAGVVTVFLTVRKDAGLPPPPTVPKAAAVAVPGAPRAPAQDLGG